MTTTPEWSGVALQVDRGAGKPILAVYAGDNGLGDKKLIGPDTLFEIGSNTKEFTAAPILKLEAAGKLNIDDTIGKRLPQYPAWKNVTIRLATPNDEPDPQLFGDSRHRRDEVADIHHQFSAKDLIGFVDPANGSHFPPATGWFYSNTNYILAGLIIEAASGMNYEQALTRMILEPLGLHDTFYADGAHPGPAAAGPVMSRVPRALYLLQDCLGYQPEPCSVSTLAPLIGKDMRTAEPIVGRGSGRDHLEPARSRSMDPRSVREARHSRKAARRDDHAGLEQDRPASSRGPADEPAGFGLGLGRFDRKELGGAYWFYEGETLGFRTIFAYWPQYDLLITGSVNSRPPNGEDKFGPAVIGGAFTALHEAAPPEGAPKAAAK